MKTTIKGLHKSIQGANQDYMRDVLNMSKLIAWWQDNTNTSLNRKEVLNLSARFFILSLLTPQFIVENCGQSKEVDGKLIIVQKQRDKVTGKYILSDLPVVRFSPSIAGNAIKNYCYKQQAIISSQQPTEKKETPKDLNNSSLLNDQQKEVEKTEKRVNANKRQTAANAKQKAA